MCFFFFFSSRRRHTRSDRDWSSDVCSSDLRRRCSTATTTPGAWWRSSSKVARRVPTAGDRPAPSPRLPLLGGSYRAGARLLRVFPPGLRNAAATPGGTAWFWLSAAQRRAALDNYAAAFGRDRSDPVVSRVARRAFQNYGRMLMDFLLLGSLTPDALIARMS